MTIDNTCINPIATQFTFTCTFPAAKGKVIASNVKLPVPNGKLQVLDADASPEHCTNVPIAPVIFKSKVAPVTDSSKAPMPVKVVFVPRVMESGVNEEILAWVAPAPQSDHVLVG